MFVIRWFVWYVVLNQARLADHPVGDVDVHKLVSGSGQGLLHTHYAHIKAKGNMSNPCLEILSCFSSFFHLLLHIHWRQVQRSPLLFSFPDSHPIHHYVSCSFLTFDALISFFTSQFSLFTLYFTSHIFLCI